MMNSGNGKNGNGRAAELETLLVKAAGAQAGNASRNQQAHGSLHPAWEAFIRYCAELRHGELERLKIQDGLPMMAELATRKVKFSS